MNLKAIARNFANKLHQKKQLLPTLLAGICLSSTGWASAPVAAAIPQFVPHPPKLAAKQAILMDAKSGEILASQGADERVFPASLTKMMTAYLTFHALKSQSLRLEDQVTVSRKAWKMGGSRMFLEPSKGVSVDLLLQGIIVDSGNDACVAMAEHLAGSEDAFADMMNQTAQYLGMKHTHFTDSTGLPNPEHYTTARDLAALSQALLRDFPEYLHYFKQKKLTYNHISQSNRNNLLWRDTRVNGLKTGHTEEAGHCLASSAQSGNTTLIAIVLGSPTVEKRNAASQSLLNWGFRFFESMPLYHHHETVLSERVWGGQHAKVPLGVLHTTHVTLPQGRGGGIQINIEKSSHELAAPIKQGQVYAEAKVSVDGKVIASIPLVALEDDPKGGLWTRFKDSIGHRFQHWFA